MNVFKRIFTPYRLKEVYTPTRAAELTYVKRAVLEDDLKKYLFQPGKQIVIYGHSGSGKTTLLLNILKQIDQKYIKVLCESKTTFNDIMLQAFDELNRFFVSEKTANFQYSINNELKADYKAISAKVSETYMENDGEKQVRYVPPQLTPKKLAEFLGESKHVLVIEDFHKVPDDEKRRIADVAKIFIDVANTYENVRIICIGAVGTARELIELDSNLNNRVAEMFVPLLNDSEIRSLISKGNSLLNISMSENLTNKICYYSNNLGSVAHQIGYDICYNNQVRKSQIVLKKVDDSKFRYAVESYLKEKSDTFSKLYDSIASQKGGWKVLKTFGNSGLEALTFEQVFKEIATTGKQRNFTNNEIADLLSLLRTPEYQEIIRYDRASRKYSISSPFFIAYLKMKFALEEKEQNEKYAKKKKKRDHQLDIGSNVQSVHLEFDTVFFDEYNRYLENIYHQMQQRRSRVENSIRAYQQQQHGNEQ